MTKHWPCIVVTTLCCLLAVAASASAQTPPESKFGDALGDADLEGVRRALQAGADPNERYGGRGASALRRTGLVLMIGREGNLLAAEEERKIIAVFDLLFEAGARLTASERTILHGPAIAGAPLVTKYLLERGADSNGADSDGNTPAIFAIKYGHDNLVPILLAFGAKPLDPKAEVQVKFVVAASKGDLIALRKQLQRGARINEQDPTGGTALVSAIEGGKHKGGNLAVVRELLHLNANPNLPGRFILTTGPLHAAVFDNERDFERDNGPTIVEELLKAGAHVSSTDSYEGQTPLHLAARMNNAKAVALLLRAGAKVMPRDANGKTPLDLAEAAPVIQLLKAAGATER